jgi:hypothetical protein
MAFLKGADGLKHRALCRSEQEGSGLFVLLYYNIKNTPALMIHRHD